jgi:hypothetical protein
MSTIYYIETKNGKYSLNATVRATTTLSARATDNPVESGAYVADHYFNFPDTFSFEGTLTDIDTPNKPVETVEEFNRVMKELEPFTIYHGEMAYAETCVFESVVVSQDVKHGTVTGSAPKVTVNSFRINASVKKIRLVGARTDAGADPVFRDAFEEPNSGNPEAGQDSPEEPPSQLRLGFGQLVQSLFG